MIFFINLGTSTNDLNENLSLLVNIKGGDSNNICNRSERNNLQ